MQLLMSFLKTSAPEGGAPVWPTLEQTQKDEIVATLARLIAGAVAHSQADVDEDEEEEEACDE